MRYILGIDTTFHTCGVGLVDEGGKVFANEKISIDLTDENAERFFGRHLKDTLSLVKPIMNKYSKDIFLISVVNQKGPFHSMPVGAIVANTLSYFLDKGIVGVDHEVGHLYSNWLDRNQIDFKFPIVSLSISGAHTNIWLLKGHDDIVLARRIFFQEDEAGFSGLGALFDWLCYYGLGIGIKKGEGGAYLERLAHDGEPKYYHHFDFDIKSENGNFKFTNVRNYLLGKIKELGYYSLNSREYGQFQKDFARSLLEALFDLLIKMIKEAISNFWPKEIHLAGGAGINKILADKLNKFCQSENLIFRAPLKADFCGDNGAMTAIAGYYQWKSLSPKEREEKKFLPIKPSNWYYKYYADKFLKW